MVVKVGFNQIQLEGFNLSSIPDVNLEDFHFDLPKHKIAEFPLKDRSKSKLLVVNRETYSIEEKNFFNLSSIIDSNHHLVFNNTKVINARLFVKKDTGGAAEVLLLNPLYPSNDPQITLNNPEMVQWKCMIGGKKIEPGRILYSIDDSLKIKVIEKDKNIGICEFNWDNNKSFIDILDEIGKIPLPPYIERELIEDDSITYQTVYAKDPGSVAAPTAGLHFTDKILSQLKQNGTTISELTLHVGAGTFQPIQTDNIKEHEMHKELIHVSKQQLDEIVEALEQSRKIVAVGTTSIRTLESLAIFGEKLEKDPEIKQFDVQQWDPYNNTILHSLKSMKNVQSWMMRNKLDNILGETGLIIIPGYEFRIVDHLITNFHQPESTLILLVVAFLGKQLWQKSYNYALVNDFRFLSYGDSSILM
jgi:S-adenosylmethionine:tRNA ribosyltransferase-isomerase